jgi:hypothetical protein
LVIYYLITPLFAALDFFGGLDFRAAGLDSGVHRAAYYVLCTGLGIVGHFVTWLRVPMALAESAFNIAVLVIGTYVGFLDAQDALIAGANVEIFGTQQLFTFLLSGSVLIIGFHTRLRDLHSGAK